ncbi:MAG: LicD family protein [Magnetococcus sp. DMHC-6]
MNPLEPRPAKPFIIWTLQKSGGRHLGEWLLDRCRLQGKNFGEDRLEETLTSMDSDAMDAILFRRLPRKHNIERVPWEVTRALVDATIRADYEHIFLYRLHVADRILLGHVAKSMENGTQLDTQSSLPIDELVSWGRDCESLLQETWNYLELQGILPWAITLDPPRSALEEEKIHVNWHAMLQALELSKGDTSDDMLFPNELMNHVPGMEPLVEKFADGAKLDSQVQQFAHFTPGVKKFYLKSEIMEPSCSWVVRTMILSLPPMVDEEQTFAIDGTVVLAKEAPKGGILRLEGGSQTLKKMPIKWGLPSPWMAKKYPEAKNCGRARFHVQGVRMTPLVPLEIYLEVGSNMRLLLVRILGQPLSPRENVHNIGSIYFELVKLASQPERKESVYLMRQKQLETFPKWERGWIWQEAEILLDCLFLRNSVEVYHKIRELKQTYLKKERPDLFEQFWARILKLIYPKTIGYHGYSKALSSQNEQELWTEIKKYVDQVATLGYDCFVNSGTLLGYVREGKLIAHDDDVDLALLLKSKSDIASLVDEWREVIKKLASIGILDKKIAIEKHIHLKIRPSRRLKVDIFPAWIFKDRLYIYPHTYGELPWQSLLPLRPISICGVQVPIPQQPESILEINYGPAWKKPDPTFKFDWSGANAKFHEFISCFNQKKTNNINNI